MHTKIMQGFVLTLCLLMASLAMDIQGGHAPKEFDVGDERGWRVPDADDPDAYNHWAQRMRFQVGDSIRFEYQNDSVVEVDKYGYYHCRSDAAVSSSNDGNTVIILERPGFIYFISGDHDHCKNGQRMIVDVMSPHARSHPSGAVSPESGPWATSSGPASVSAQVAAVTIIMSVYALI